MTMKHKYIVVDLQTNKVLGKNLSVMEAKRLANKKQQTKCKRKHEGSCAATIQIYRSHIMFYE